MTKIKILLVDDHKLVISGFKMILSQEESFEVVGVADNGLEGIDLCEKLNADVVLLDINLPQMSGIEAAKKIKKSNPNVKVIMLSMNEEEDYIFNADRVGADGYLLKSIENDELIKAINSVYAGEKYYSKTINVEIISNVKNKSYQADFDSKNILTARELDIIREISLGSSNKEIAERLYISDRTVNTHKTNIYKKLNVKNSVEMLVKVKEKKLI